MTGFGETGVRPWIAVLSPAPAPIAAAPQAAIAASITWGDGCNFPTSADDFPAQAAEIPIIYAKDKRNTYKLKLAFLETQVGLYDGLIFTSNYSQMDFFGPDIIGENAAQLRAVAEWKAAGGNTLLYPHAGRVMTEDGSYRDPLIFFNFKLRPPENFPKGQE
jgi:hypothetical protein